jgi:hypothetical protein
MGLYNKTNSPSTFYRLDLFFFIISVSFILEESGTKFEMHGALSSCLLTPPMVKLPFYLLLYTFENLVNCFETAF